MLLAEADPELSHLRSCIAKFMKKADECQELQRGEIPGVFENKQSLEENFRMQTNKPAVKFSSGSKCERAWCLSVGRGRGEPNEDGGFLTLYLRFHCSTRNTFSDSRE